MELDVSIDRLTIIGEEQGIEGYLRESGYITRQNFSQNYGFRHTYHCQNGEVLEIGEKGKVRIDFNPNKANMTEIRDMLSRIKYPRLTRMDIAIDYFGVDLSNVEWLSEKKRKRNSWFNHNGVLETEYIGAPQSEKRFRIYNKRLERLEAGEEHDPRASDGHWRVEVQQRYKGDNLFEPLDYFYNDLFDIKARSKGIDLSHITKVNDRIMVRGLLSDPSELEVLSKNSRTKYNKMIAEAKERAGKVLEIEPHEVYENKKSLLVSELTSLFAQCAMPLAHV